jgi:hypothetical protein
MPAAGKTAMGSNDVTGIGIGSKIHHTTHSHPSTAVMTISELWSSDRRIRLSKKPVITPGQTVRLGSR